MTTAGQPSRTTSPVRLRDVLPQARFVGCNDIFVHDLTERSQDCQPSWLFAAIPGSQTDGANFVRDAVDRGAVGVLVNRPMADLAVPQCVVPDVRTAFAEICSAYFQRPSQKLQIAGVTGTNGKTTVTWMIRDILRHAGHRCGLLGTVEYDDGTGPTSSSLTTPDTKTFAGWLSRMAGHGTTHAAVELSSHSLHQGRVAGTELAAAVVTNITQDHFDYHQTFANYQASKARIAELLRPKAALMLNQDDPGTWELRHRLPATHRIVSFSLHHPADVSARIISESLDRTLFRLSFAGQSVTCSTPLIGRHNIENALAAAAVCAEFGVSLSDIADALRRFRGAPGRLERISCGQPFDVLVDYAHTDDALRRCLQTLRSVTPGRILCVFGAGGDRDRSKRPRLGLASQLADVPIVTSDNPRSEEPARIADDIVAGFDAKGCQPVVQLDRVAAIQTALQMARPGDSVLIAGKGHENEQIFRDHRIPFDDRAVARQALVELMARQSRMHRRGA